MKKTIKLLLVVSIALILSLATAAIAETADYSFLDDMNLNELEALQTELSKRIKDARAANAAENPSDFGIWEIKYFVDEFNMPTSDGYVGNRNLISGTFSNSATNNSELSVRLIVDSDGDVQIFLYEYGRSLVKNIFSKSKKYNVVMMDGAGTRRTLSSGAIYSNGDRLMFSSASENANIIQSLSAGGTVRFAISEDDGFDSYIFAINETIGFGNAYNELMGK